MKLKNLTINKITATSSYLLKIKKYLKNDSFYLPLNNLNIIDINIKKIFKLIFEYHQYNKTIIFIGFPDIKEFNFSLLFNRFNYIFLKKNIWINGILCNSRYLIPYINSKRFNSFFNKENIIFLKNFNSLVKLKKNPDLIVLFSGTDNKNVIFEANKLKLPIISFVSHSSDKNLVILSNIFTIFSKKYPIKLIGKLIYFLLSSILFRYIKKSVK